MKMESKKNEKLKSRERKFENKREKVYIQNDLECPNYISHRL